MTKKTLNIFLILLLFFACTSFIFAQGRQTGSISGTVMDKEGNFLPGATVTISGPALLGQRTYVTSERGIFRFPALSPGKDYELRVEMPGFKTVIRPGLIVNVGRTSEANIEMEITTLEEEITVTAESPVVDVETSKISVNYSTDFLATLPMNRDLYGIQNSIPGAISSGNAYRRTSSILGGTVRSSLYALDGIPMNDPATWYSMVNINVDVYEEIEFGIGALPAEVGQTDSTYINIVTKSGGNKFSGGLNVVYTGDDFSQNLFSDEQMIALNVNAPETYSDYKDFSLNFGGPLIKDKIWFFLNGRRQTYQQVNPETHDIRIAKIADANPGMFTPEQLQHYDLEHQEWMGFGKLTFQLTDNIRYMGMLHYNNIYEPVYSNRTGNSYSWDTTFVWDHETDYTTTHQFNWVLDQNTFVDIRGTYVRRWFPINSREESHGNYRFYDKEEAVYWGMGTYDDEYIRKKMLASISLTRFQDDFLGASHEFKAGAEFEATEYNRDWYRPGNPWYSYWMDFNAGNPYYESTSGRRGRLYIRRCPDEGGQWNVQDHTKRFSGFIQDSITTGKLAINLGLRLDHSFQYEPEQSRPELRYSVGPYPQNPDLGPNDILEGLIDQWHEDIGPVSPFDALTMPYKKVVQFTTLSPRLGLVYDIFGDGKTALKLSFARYYEPVWSAKYNAGQIFGAGTVSWAWYDLNKNKLMDLVGTDRYRLRSAPSQDPNIFYYADDLKSPYTHEFLAGIEHEVIKDFKLGLQFVYKLNKNIVEDVDKNNGYDPTATDDEGLIWLPYDFVDPGMDGEFGTSDDQNMTIYGLRDDRPVPTWEGINPPEAKREYTAGILTFDKRMSNRWQLKGSILYSAFKGNALPSYSETEGQSSLFDDPNDMINSYGRVTYDRPLQIKIMGTYIFPLDIIFTAYFQHRSGSAWGRTLDRVYFPSSMDVQESYVFVRAETRGTRRNVPYSMLDLRVEKRFSLGNAGRLSIYADIFNVGGRKGVNVNQNPYGRLRYYRDPPSYTLSTTYADITSIYGVQSFRLGLKWNF